MSKNLALNLQCQQCWENIFSCTVQKWYDWCQTRRDLWQTPVWDPHPCWSQTVIFWHGGQQGERCERSAVVEDCEIAICQGRKNNRRPAVGAHLWVGGKRQLEGSSHLKSRERLHCGHKGNTCPSVSIRLAFLTSSYEYDFITQVIKWCQCLVLSF